MIKEMKACEACLDLGHTAETCPRNLKCDVLNCNGLHHRLLHDACFSAKVNTTTVNCEQKGDTLLQLQTISGGRRGGEKSPLNTFWDPGSTMSFITFTKANILQLKGRNVGLEVTPFGGAAERLDSKVYDLVLVDKLGNSIVIQVLGV